MYSPGDSESDSSDIDINNNNRLNCKIERNQSIMNLIPRKFREAKSTNLQSMSSVKVSCKNRLTMRTKYDDLSLNQLGLTEYLYDKLFLPRMDQKLGKTITENVQSSSNKHDQSLDACHFETGKKSLVYPHSSPFVSGDGIRINSPHGDQEDHHFIHERYDALENLISKFSNSPKPHRVIIEKYSADVNENGRKSSSSDNRKRSLPDDDHHSFSSNSPFIPDPNNHSNVGYNEEETEDDSEKIFYSPKKKAFFFHNDDEFNDKFLSPFEFNVENRQNHFADEFTPISSDNFRKNHSPHSAFQMNEEFLAEPFEFEDRIQPMDDDLVYEYVNRVNDADDCSRSNRPESSVLQKYDHRQRDPIFDPVRHQNRDDSNSFHFRFSPMTTTDVYSRENVSHGQRDMTSERSSPSLIEATPFSKNFDYPWEKYHRESEKVSCLPPRTEVDVMIKNGDEVHFRASEERESANNHEDVDHGLDITSPISFKMTPALVPLISYIHNGRLIIEDFSD